ncbi:MAG TPA: hypothetical protein PK843_16475 [bacterium]|nr:hypothetical protein [bacterium]HPN36108.1 hypothetical protein [bacterium]
MTKIVSSHGQKGFLRILSLSVLTVVTGCSDEGVINSPVAAPLPVQRINRIVVDERTVTVEVTCWTPDPCYTYLWTEETIQGTDYYFRIFGRSTGHGPCPCVVGSIDVPVSITTPRAGRYGLHFWTYSGTSVDTSIVVSRTFYKLYKVRG